jgi:hypothetical protein
LDVEVHDYVLDLQIIKKEKGVEALVMQICGKSDDVPKDLIIWADEEYPELCPICHLLLYVKLSSLKSGCLFPPEWKLHQMLLLVRVLLHMTMMISWPK